MKREKRFTALAGMAGLVPAIHVVPPDRPLRMRLAPFRLSVWAARELNHVDGRDKPNHDGK
jgi:hypothetical protein